MKKSTLFLVAAALVLGVVAILVTRGGDKPTVKKLDIPGYATAEQLERDKRRGLMDPAEPIAHPIDEIVLEREDGTLRVVREGEGDKQQWRLTQPVDAAAVKWHLDAIAEVFKSPTTRSDARAIKPADLPLFDLEPGRRIGLTLKSKGSVWNGVDLWVGQVVKDSGPESEGEVVKGTWVMLKSDESTAFLIADKDLRTPSNKTLSELRDKKAFTFEEADISKVEIISPSGSRVALTSTQTEEPPAPEAGPDAKPTTKVTWTLSEPANVKGDATVSGVARSLAGLRVNDFIAPDQIEEAARTALAGKVWKVTATVADKPTTLIIAETGRNKDTVWAQIEGRTELLSLTTWTAKALQKTLEDLKDKTVWDVPADSITELTLKGDAGPLTVSRGPDGWAFTAPPLPHPADPGSLLPSLAKISAVRWARPDEVAVARQALATPDISATVKGGAATYVITMSSTLAGDDANNRWAAVGDPNQAEPFLISDFNAKRFVSTPDALRMKKLFPGLDDKLQSVSVTLAGSKDTVRFERPSTGGALALTGLLPGETQNDEAVRTLVATLTALEVKTFHEGKTADVTGLSTDKAHVVELVNSDGQRATLLLSTVSSGDAESYALVSDGPQKNIPVGLNEYQVKNIARARADFVKAPAPAP